MIPAIYAVIKGVARFPECSGIVAGPPAEMLSIGTRRPFEEEERRRLPEPVEAHQLTEDARSVGSRTKVHRGSAALCLGPADHHIGLLLATAGRGTEARQHLRTAVALADAMGSPPFSAAASVELARVLSSGDDEERAEAAVLLEGASATARRLGLARLAAQADALTR